MKKFTLLPLLLFVVFTWQLKAQGREASGVVHKTWFRVLWWQPLG